MLVEFRRENCVEGETENGNEHADRANEWIESGDTTEMEA